MQAKVRELPSYRKKRFLLWGAAVIPSLLVNLYLHYIWIHDSYTGFMDTSIGHLSAAGWWHLGFSTLEMSIVFYYVLVWFFLIKVKAITRETYSLFKKGWNIMLLFTSLSFLDLICKIHLFKETALVNFFQSLITPLLSIAVVVFFSKVHRNT